MKYGVVVEGPHDDVNSLFHRNFPEHTDHVERNELRSGWKLVLMKIRSELVRIFDGILSFKFASGPEPVCKEFSQTVGRICIERHN